MKRDFFSKGGSTILLSTLFYLHDARFFFEHESRILLSTSHDETRTTMSKLKATRRRRGKQKAQSRKQQGWMVVYCSLWRSKLCKLIFRCISRERYLVKVIRLPEKRQRTLWMRYSWCYCFLFVLFLLSTKSLPWLHFQIRKDVLLQLPIYWKLEVCWHSSIVSENNFIACQRGGKAISLSSWWCSSSFRFLNMKARTGVKLFPSNDGKPKLSFCWCFEGKNE